MKAIYNSKIISSHGLIENRVLIFDKYIIDCIDACEINRFDIDEVLDAGGGYTSPGFIDIHIHGCSSYDTMDSTIEALENISIASAEAGVTSILPTTMTAALDNIHKALNSIRQLQYKGTGAKILGCHMEGPFISREYKGAHKEENILKPDFKLIEKYRDLIKVVTIAPELEGAMDFIKHCKQNGIIASLGHTAASYEMAIKAVEAGADSFTHTFNGMSSFRHREPGALGAAMTSDAYCELIADNIHCHKAAQSLLLRAKGIDKIILVSDSIRACKLKDGEYELGGQTIYVKNGTARLSDGTLAGSTITLNKALANFINTTNLDIVSAVKTVSANPARLLGIENKKGTIAVGKDSDLVVFDKNLNITMTISKGEVIYRRK